MIHICTPFALTTIPPMLPTIVVGPNQLGHISADNPALLKADIDAGCAVCAWRDREAALIHLTPTGHARRDVFQNGVSTSTYRAFVLNAVQSDIEPESRRSIELYLSHMIGWLDPSWSVEVAAARGVLYSAFMLNSDIALLYLRRIIHRPMIRHDAAYVEMMPICKGRNHG